MSTNVYIHIHYTVLVMIYFELKIEEEKSRILAFGAFKVDFFIIQTTTTKINRIYVCMYVCIYLYTYPIF